MSRDQTNVRTHSSMRKYKQYPSKQTSGVSGQTNVHQLVSVHFKERMCVVV